MKPTTRADVRILILDDEEIIVNRFAEVFKEAGYSDVVGFTDPNTAVEYLHQHRVDAIFADIDLRRPDFDGIAFLDAARNVPFKFIFSGYLNLHSDLQCKSDRKGNESFEEGNKCRERMIQKLDSLFAFHHISLPASR